MKSVTHQRINQNRGRSLVKEKHLRDMKCTLNDLEVMGSSVSRVQLWVCNTFKSHLNQYYAGLGNAILFHNVTCGNITFNIP